MTIETLVRKVQYAGDDSQVNFQFTYPIHEETDLNVILTDSAGAETTQVLNTNYSVPISGSFDEGGTIVMVVPPATGELLTIERVVPLVQESRYIENDPFPAQTQEDNFDRGIMIDQQLQDSIGLCIKIPVSDTGITVELPTSVNRADTVLIFDSNGDVNVTTFSALLSAGAVDYLLRDGSRPMTGNLNLDSNDITNINTATVVEQLVIPLNQPTSLINGSIWIE